MASTEKSFTVSGNAVTYTGTVSGYRYEYDANNNLTKLTCNVNGSSWDTTYTYDKDNRPISALLDNGRSIVNTYDAIGRLTSRALKNGSVTVRNTAITYVPGADGSKTAVIASYQNGSDAAYSYTYDANGNITGITQGTASFTYEYDKANQLIRENLYYGSGDSNNATYTYEYDAWGNILNKKKYAYTTGTLGSVLNTKTYSYTNSQWGDLLTSYNGSTITYDAMGNPTSYLGKTLSWEGKRLMSYTNGSTSITYAYNEDGLRLNKTVGTNKTEYYYNGSVLIGMKIGTGSSAKVLRFSYDAGGNVVAVDYSSNNGSSFTTYYYLRNAQNDVIKLIDGSGNTVVEYTYDSWGKLLSVTGSLSGTLGEDQPFRYRGYVYDTETGWYYLQSRYYDPTTCRFISADVLLSTGQGVIGHNSFAYCGNNPIAREDPSGLEWWHWAIAGALVVAAAAACVITCGGAAPAIAAVAMVASGSAAATASATVAAGVFIGASTALACSAMAAAADSNSVGDFMDHGNWGTVAGTATGGVIGGCVAYGYWQSQGSSCTPQLDNGRLDDCLDTQCFVAGTLVKTEDG